MSFHITRQRDFDDNCLYVEISAGGKKHAGPDILTPRYAKEAKTYSDPRDAINIAVEIYKSWEHDYGDEKKRLRIVVKPQPPLVFDFTANGIQAAKNWADKTYAGMTRCGHCTKPLGKRIPYDHQDLPNQVFCCEACIATRYRNTFGVELPKIEPKKKSFVFKKV